MLIGIPAETAAGETRVAATPETVKKLKAQGHTLKIQSGAGVAASVTDAAYVAAGAEITDAAGALGADMVLKATGPNLGEAYLRLKDTAAARVQAQKALDLDPSLPEAHAMLGAVAGSLRGGPGRPGQHCRAALM